MDFNGSGINVISTKTPIETSIYNALTNKGTIELNDQIMNSLTSIIKTQLFDHINKRPGDVKGFKDYFDNYNNCIAEANKEINKLELPNIYQLNWYDSSLNGKQRIEFKFENFVDNNYINAGGVSSNILSSSTNDVNKWYHDVPNRKLITPLIEVKYWIIHKF